MKNNCKFYMSLYSVCLLLFPMIAQSQETPELPAIKIETESGFDIYPGLSTQMVYDDNIANTRNNKTSSLIAIVSPVVIAQLLDGPDEYNIGAGVSYGHHFNNQGNTFDFQNNPINVDDNFTDLFFNAGAKLELSDRHRFEIEGEFNKDHAQRGTGVRDGQGGVMDVPVELETVAFFSTFEYGSYSTPARVKLSAGYYDRKFNNYPEFTRFRDFSNMNLGLGVFYDIGPFTSLVAEVINNHVHFIRVDENVGNRDNLDTRYQVGIDWQATAATSGEARIGYQEKKFELENRDDFEGLSWDVGVTWQPLSYSTFKILTGRVGRDPDLNTDIDVIDETSHKFTWDHEWTDDFVTDLGVHYIESEYKGRRKANGIENGEEQRDTYWQFRLGAEYQLSDWITLDAGAEYNDRDSNDDAFIYDKTVISIGVSLNI